MPSEQRGQIRQMTDLQTDATGVVGQAADGPVEIRRYGKPVAYVESVEQHREHQELDAALDRAIWAVDIAKSLRNVSEGKFKRWGEVAAMLKARYPGR